MNKVQQINDLISRSKTRTGKISDGYHMFDELYEQRTSLFLILCKVANLGARHSGNPPHAWRSKKHFDGKSCPKGWFVAGLDTEPGEQVTFHLPIKLWKDTSFLKTYPKVPAFDGHNSKDVLLRLKKMYMKTIPNR